MSASGSGGAALELRGIRKSFGAIAALDGITLRMAPGELCGLIGPNGSGKSTLFDCCTGMTRPDDGVVMLDGIDITAWPMHRIAREGGLVRSFQRNVVLGTMTLEESLLVAGQMHRYPGILSTFLHGRATRRRDRALRDRAYELLELVDLVALAGQRASQLSVGQQRLLQFAMALMPSPRAILLDEPMAGVNPTLIDRLNACIRLAHRELGTTIVIIEHNIDVIVETCPRVVVLNAGQLVTDGPPAAVIEDPRVIEAYLGG